MRVISDKFQIIRLLHSSSTKHNVVIKIWIDRISNLKYLVWQEVFVDPSRDESLIFELLDFKSDVGDNGSASWFLQDLAREQDAEAFKVTHLNFGIQNTIQFHFWKFQPFLYSSCAPKTLKHMYRMFEPFQ